MKQPHISAPAGQVFWRYDIPQDRGSKTLLLTVGGICVTGTWLGDLGQYYIAWAPMPKRDKAAERLIFNQEKK